MVLSSNPRVMAVEPDCGYFTDDVMDFWRPNYRDEALVDGKYSVKVYLHALEQAWKHFHEDTGQEFDAFSRFCYHLPFTRMAMKAHFHFSKIAGGNLSGRQLQEQVEDGLLYNRQIGNCYTAALYIGLLSLLENTEEDLGGKRIGMFSYGSGCMGAFFNGVVTPGYRDALFPSHHQQLLDSREKLSIDQYESFYSHALPEDGRHYDTPNHQTGGYRLCGIDGHKRVYAPVKQEASALASSAAAQPRAAAPVV